MAHPLSCGKPKSGAVTCALSGSRIAVERQNPGYLPTFASLVPRLPGQKPALTGDGTNDSQFTIRNSRLAPENPGFLCLQLRLLASEHTFQRELAIAARLGEKSLAANDGVVENNNGVMEHHDPWFHRATNPGLGILGIPGGPDLPNQEDDEPPAKQV